MGKRLFDVCLAFALLILALPVCGIIALAVMADSGRPVFYPQKRVGYRGRHFTMYKFRTLRPHSERRFDIVLKNDERVTRVGRFLRSSHLDELPQLWNVLRGDMSLVGPRPHTVDTVEAYVRADLHYAETLKMMPGLTGLNQLRGREKIIAKGAHNAVLLDRYYARRRHVGMDLRILAKTAAAVLRRTGV